MGHDIKVIIGLAGAFAIGILLTCVASFVPLEDKIGAQAWPLTALVFYFLAPFPNLMCARCGGGGDMMMDDGGRVWKDMGYFITGFLMLSGLALPAVLAHAEVISVGALALTIVGGIIIFGAVSLYAHVFKDRDEFGFS